MKILDLEHSQHSDDKYTAVSTAHITTYFKPTAQKNMQDWYTTIYLILLDWILETLFLVYVASNGINHALSALCTFLREKACLENYHL